MLFIWLSVIKRLKDWVAGVRESDVQSITIYEQPALADVLAGSHRILHNIS
ncbi:MAG: hypothetical protein ACSLEM_02320 [Candidatus Malihini olakiniferum]